MRARFAAVALTAFSLSACSTLEPLPLVSDLPRLPVPEALRIEETVDTPGTLIERALSGCDKRTEAGEGACVKAALVAAHVTVPELTAMLRDCRGGRVCHTTYTTEDSVGLIRSAASHFVVHWRVDVDLSKPADTIAAVPITVVQV